MRPPKETKLIKAALIQVKETGNMNAKRDGVHTYLVLEKKEYIKWDNDSEEWKITSKGEKLLGGISRLE